MARAAPRTALAVIIVGVLVVAVAWFLPWTSAEPKFSVVDGAITCVCLRLVVSCFIVNRPRHGVRARIAIWLGGSLMLGLLLDGATVILLTGRLTPGAVGAVAGGLAATAGAMGLLVADYRTSERRITNIGGQAGHWVGTLSGVIAGVVLSFPFLRLAWRSPLPSAQAGHSYI